MHTTEKNISAVMRCTGGTVTLPLSSWLAKCEQYEDWHDLPASERKPTIASISRFLRHDYDFLAE